MLLIFLARLSEKLGVIRRPWYQPYRKMVWHPVYKKKHLSTAQRRYVRDEQLPDEWTNEVVSYAKEYWDHACAVCKSKENLHRDHLVPVAHVSCPGAIPSNLLILCQECNEDKSALDFAQWYQMRYGYYPDRLIDRIHDWQWACFMRGWN